MGRVVVISQLPIFINVFKISLRFQALSVLFLVAMLWMAMLHNTKVYQRCYPTCTTMLRPFLRGRCFRFHVTSQT